MSRRVLYVEGNVDGTVGGSYFSLLYLASGLDRNRFEPVVVFATDNALRPAFESARVRTVVLPMGRGAHLKGYFGRAMSRIVNFCHGWVLDPLRLLKFLRSEHIDLVHLNNSITRNHAWIIAAGLARIPCVTHERGINTHFSLRTRLLAGRFDAVICISAAVRDNLAARGLGRLPLLTIHNGLDPEQMLVTRSAAEIRAELGLDSSSRLVGLVGNIRAWKGQEVVVRAVGLLKEEFPQLACLLIGHASSGDTAYRDRLTQLIDALGLRDRVFITGHRTDVANYVNALELQIHASTDPEPFGRVLLEAMALKKPLVASDGGAVPEIIVDGQTGLLFEPGRPEALASALRRLLNDPTRATAMGAAGYERLKAEFSIEQNLRQTQALYGHLLQGT